MMRMDGHGTIDADLSAALEALQAAEGYRVVEVLKKSEFEVTELVAPHGTACGPDGSPVTDEGADGLFVRKRIRLDAGMGTAYEALFAAQRGGVPLPHTPRIELCVRLGDELTVVMERVSGPTLEKYVAVRGAGSDRARELMGPLCDAVTELHEAFDPPLIHRDLKPSNIIISDGGGGRAPGAPVIIDFGIARTWRAGAEADTVHLGTRGYAAPEQFGFGQTDERSDVYALGMLLFFCCTGGQPRAGLDAAALAAAGVPEGLATVILRATAFDPAARYQSAAELKSALAGTGSSWAGGPHPGAAARTTALNGAPSTPQSSWNDCDRNGGDTAVQPVGPGPFQRFSNGLGRAWNAVVVMVWSFFMIILAMCVGDSLGGGGEYPLWYAICLYGGFGGAGFSAVAWLLYDKRRLRERYFKPWGLKRRHEWLAFLILAAVSALFFLFLLVAEALRDALLS